MYKLYIIYYFDQNQYCRVFFMIKIVFFNFVQLKYIIIKMMYLKILENNNNNNSETYRVLNILYTSHHHHEYKVHFIL